VALRVQLAATFLIVTPLIALVLAAVNLRRGSADRRGARRVAWAVVLSSFAALLLAPDHAYGPADESTGLERLFAVLISAAMAWFVYIGLEPWARRFRPRLLIAWTRVLAGSFRDALVGRSLLTGAVVGTLFVVIDQVDRWVCGALGTAPLVPAITAEHLAPAFDGLRIAAVVISRFPSSLSLVLPFVLSLVIVRRWLPVRWSGPTAYLLYTIVFWGLLANDPKVSLFVSAPLTALVALLTLERVGLLSIVTAATIAYLLVGSPLSLTLGAWYSTGTLVALALTLVVALAGLWLACAPPRSAALGRLSSQENF
jgi:hypothetical protein